MGELAVGFRLGTRREANEAELDRFVAHPAVEVLPVSEDVVNVYAAIVLDLKTAGTPLPANDIWIAAVAARHGATVLTYDAHFRTIAKVAATILTAASTPE
jgi:tRNA(fMet)-specific endonuclease VapC